MEELTKSVIAHVELYELLKSLSLSIVFALILSFVIRKYSRIIGDRSQYTLIMLTLIPTMVLIITIVKSSLALSLGLVGALSIVRFRTPIKEPEELIYLFVAIAVGLGLGANQRVATTVSFLFIMLVVMVFGHFRSRHIPQGVFIEIDGPLSNGQIGVEDLCKMFRKHDVAYELKRYSNTGNSVSATFFTELSNVTLVDAIRRDTHALDDGLTMTVIDQTRHIN